MVFYLKINRRQEYTYRNLGYWLDVMSVHPNARIYILCDKKDLTEQVKDSINMEGMTVEYLESERSSTELKTIVDKTSNDHWKFAAYAHLTTFLHARENNIEKYWNIDADDTCFCLDAQRTRDLLDTAETIAIREGKKAFSLDMWTTKTWGEHWSFGVTYTENPSEWLEIMNRHLDDKDFFAQNEQPCNIDGFFSYLRFCYPDVIGTFYAENLRFIHYADDFFKRPWSSGLFHWKNGKLELPILRDCFDLISIGNEEIAKDIDKIDIGITDEEAYRFLLNHTHKTDYDSIMDRLNRRGERYV